MDGILVQAERRTERSRAPPREVQEWGPRRDLALSSREPFLEQQRPGALEMHGGGRSRSRGRRKRSRSRGRRRRG